MKNSKLKKSLSFLILLVYLTTLPIAFGGVVLCQGSDGHVRIEFANGGHCAELPLENSDGHNHSSNSESSVIQCELSQCGDCEDIPLALVASNEGLPKSITLLKLSPQLLPPPFFAIYNQQKPFLTASLSRMVPFNNFPSILRTTVLLI